MSNKNPRCRMVSIPAEFMPLLEKELDEKGYFNYAQLTGEILAEHFKGKNPKATKEKTLVKGAIQGEKGS